MLTYLFENARIYDGTGSPWLRGSVGVDGDRIILLRGDTSTANVRHRIDATHLAVAPGFIDMHSHSTMAILTRPQHDAKVRQGVTTELIGVDGNSYAPFHTKRDLDLWSLLNAGLDGEKPDQSWNSVADYLSIYDSKVAVNIAYVIGNSALRIGAVGWKNRPATITELANMRSMLREGMEEGAFGLSTGLTYPPGSYASADEIAELCDEVARLGGVYVTHIRYGSGDAFLDPNCEALDVAMRTGVGLHISHAASGYKRSSDFKTVLRLLDEAVNVGVQLSFDAYPYTHTGSRALVLLPAWVCEGGPEEALDRIQSSAIRNEIRNERNPRESRWRNGATTALTGFQAESNRRYEGLTLERIATERGDDPLDALCDLLVEEELRISQVSIGRNDPINVRQFLAHPRCMVGSDGILVGEHPSPRTYGTFPTFLGDLVRDEGLIPLAEAVRKLTSFPAQLLGLRNRGLIRDGYYADIVAFNPATIRSDATVKEPMQYPHGIDYVLVNGEMVIAGGDHTGALPGRALRRSNGV